MCDLFLANVSHWLVHGHPFLYPFPLSFFSQRTDEKTLSLVQVCNLFHWVYGLRFRLNPSAIVVSPRNKNLSVMCLLRKIINMK